MTLDEQIKNTNLLIEHIKNWADSSGKVEIDMYTWDLENLEEVLESLNRLKGLEK